MGFPALNFTNPLYTFAPNNLKFTAYKECYVCGTFLSENIDYGGVPKLKINDTVILTGARLQANNDSGIALESLSPIKIQTGDIVTVSNIVGSSATAIYILEEI